MNSLSPPQLLSSGDVPPPFSQPSSAVSTAIHAGPKYKLMSPASLPISRSPCITIPPGISPSSFLDSPVLLSHIKVEASPTTGSLFKSQTMCSSLGSTNCTAMEYSSNIENPDEEKARCFEFKPLSGLNMVSEDIDHKQSQKLLQVPNQSLPHSSTSPATVTAEATGSSAQNLSLLVSKSASQSMAAVDFSLDDSYQTSSSIGVQDHQSHKGIGLCDDGYNWRKYGQKLVKGSEFPRSYYKCTHPNCEVKKLFERTPDGRITEMVYKGAHDHPKPQPNRRYAVGAMMSIQDDKAAQDSSVHCGDEKTCYVYGQMSYAMGSSANEQSPLYLNDNTVGTVAQKFNRDEVNDDDGDDPLFKRRKMDINEVDITPIVKPIREPRVIVHTVSEVDVLDDGYRWRKYGQKVVRGNPNPRSYYKCTNAGCPVRKHVERAFHDPKAVITTYEGKHNHNVPTAKTNSGTICLNLGVGINMAAENISKELPQTTPEVILRQIPPDSSNCKVA